MSETIIRNLALCPIALVGLFESAELCFCILPRMIHAHTRTEGHLRGIDKSACVAHVMKAIMTLTRTELTRRAYSSAVLSKVA
jgi:hypothetical protein